MPGHYGKKNKAMKKSGTKGMRDNMFGKAAKKKKKKKKK